MKLLVISDYRYDESVRLQAEALVQYAFALDSEGQIDEVVMAGNMVPDVRPTPDFPLAIHLAILDDLFDPAKGLFSRLVTAGVPVRMLPGVTEAAIPDDVLKPLLGPIDYIESAYMLAPVPASIEPYFIITSASEAGPGDFYAPNGLSKFIARAVGTKGLPLSQAEQAYRLRQPAQERREAQLQARSPELLLGVIHSGAEPYFGRYGQIWAGCPGGPGFCIRLDTERPDASELLPLEQV
jgi:hypothetical protein